MANRGAVVARIVSEYSDKGTKAATKDFKKLSEDSSVIGKQFTELGKKIGKAFAIVEIAKFGFDAIRTAEAVNGAFSKMNVAFANSGSALNSSSTQVQSAVDRMAGLAFTTSETADALARGATIFHSANAALNNLGLAADIARTGNMTLTEAMTALGKASEGKLPRSLSALGVIMPKNGTEAEKYKNITDQLTKSLQGQAEAYAQTHPIEAMKAKFEELSNSIGQLLLPVFNVVVKVIDNYLLPAVLSVVNFLRENPKYLQPFANAWATIVNVFAKVAGVLLIIEAGFLRLDSVLLQVVRAAAWLGGDKSVEQWAKSAADGLGKASTALNAAGHKLSEYHMNAVQLKETSPIVIKSLGDIGAQSNATAIATSKLTAAQIAGIEALKKYGVTVKDQTSSDPIELEAARQNLVKQGNVIEQARIQALLDSAAASVSAAEATQRYSDILTALADNHISSQEVAILAEKWGISQNAVVAYIAQVTGAAAFDSKDLSSPGAVAADGWTNALASLNKYYDGLKNPPTIVIPNPGGSTGVVPSTSTTSGIPDIYLQGGVQPSVNGLIPNTSTSSAAVLDQTSKLRQLDLSMSTASFGSSGAVQSSSTTSGNSTSTVNVTVMGSVVSQSDLVAAVKTGLQQGQLSGQNVTVNALNL